MKMTEILSLIHYRDVFVLNSLKSHCEIKKKINILKVVTVHLQWECSLLTTNRLVASQCVQESRLGNSPYTTGNVQLPAASHPTSLQGYFAFPSTLAGCSASHKPESASFVVILLISLFQLIRTGSDYIISLFLVFDP